MKPYFTNIRSTIVVYELTGIGEVAFKLEYADDDVNDMTSLWVSMEPDAFFTVDKESGG